MIKLLRFKPIQGRNTYYSARVGIHYRVLAYQTTARSFGFGSAPTLPMTSLSLNSNSLARTQSVTHCPLCNRLMAL